jgi:cell division protein ZipA
MTADILRLILALAGVAVVVGVYFWERHKRLETRVQAIRRAQEDGEDADGNNLERELQSLDRLVAEKRPSKLTEPTGKTESQPPSNSHKPRGAEAPRDPLLEGVFAGDQGEMELDGESYWLDLPDSVPFKIMQINVVARAEPFSGERIQTACREVELVPGDMSIFHRQLVGGRKPKVLFSMASMVEPGSFPLDAMEEFRTPGLTLFAQLPGPRDGLAVFSDMLFTAERLASLLAGELQDETHSALTRQTIEHMREDLLEHRRQIQLARKKAKV